MIARTSNRSVPLKSIIDKINLSTRDSRQIKFGGENPRATRHHTKGAGGGGGASHTTDVPSGNGKLRRCTGGSSTMSMLKRPPSVTYSI